MHFYTMFIHLPFLWASTGQPSLFDRVNSHITECQTSSAVHCKHSISLVRLVERIVLEVNQDEGHGIVAGASSC